MVSHAARTAARRRSGGTANGEAIFAAIPEFGF
jgi:hypothetical protein